ncbi:MAG: XRE family transcriptional regulator [Curvibacter sp.]|nr:MAG: XRE family transcriptional regulator [Curvibacter sp.]
MSTLISSLKSEIARVARKELKEELLAIRKSTTTHRSEIAALKRQVKSLAAALKASTRSSGPRSKSAPESDEAAASPSIRFNPQRLANFRSKVGITQAQMAALLEVSYLSVHKWEAGASKPRAAQLQKIAAALKLGKREVLKKLQE